MRVGGRKLELLRIGALASCTVFALCAAAAPATAHASSEPPEFTLKVTEGETTVPENGVAYTSAHTNRHAQLRLSLVHAGVVAYQDSHNSTEWVGFPQVPVPGDVLVLESPLGTVVGAVTYDGLPTMDATVCAGSSNFSGQRSGAERIEGRFFTETPRLDRYGRPIPGEWMRVDEGFAQVTSLVGPTFGGNFLTPLPAGATVVAKESVEEPLGGGSIFTYESETVRPVGACPAPPAPPPPPPAPLIPTLRAALARVLFPKLGAIRRKGLRDQVYLDQRGTVVQDLFLAGGQLPAHASRSHRRPAAVLLARGGASASKAGTVTISLHPTAKGWSRMRGAHSLSVALVTTVHGVSGATITLPVRRLTLHR